MITMEVKQDDERGLGGGFTYYLDGKPIPRGFTPETGVVAARVFLALLEKQERELAALLEEYEAALYLNHRAVARGERGTNYSAFTRMEKFLNHLQKQAGIVDS